MNQTQTTVLFYISGHGFGHSTRVIEVARNLPDDVRVIFRTSAPQWLYQCYFDRPLEFSSVNLDVGVVQDDSLTLNPEKTLHAYATLLNEAPALIDRECRFVQQENVSVIVGDIPPLAFAIARQAGVPSLAMGNFCWDWIYGPYVERQPEYQWLVDEIRSDYGKCDLLLRLPFAGDLSAFPRIEDCPLVVRHSSGARQELRRKLGIDPDRKVVLLSFGGFDLERIPWNRIAEMTDFLFIYFRQKIDVENVLHVQNGSMAHVDIVQLSDIVLTKPGYGICAETIATQTPIVYTDRGEFIEYDYLVQGLETYARSVYIPQSELLSGRWRPWLEKALDLPPARQTMRTDGASVAAERILAKAQDRQSVIESE